MLKKYNEKKSSTNKQRQRGLFEKEKKDPVTCLYFKTKK